MEIFKQNIPFLVITTEGTDDDLTSYGLQEAKLDEDYCLKVVKREKNRIEFNLVKIHANP